MKEKIKTIIIILLAIAVIVLTVLFVQEKMKEPEQAEVDMDKLLQEAIREVEQGKQNNVELQEDFTRKNISEKLKEPRMLGDLEINNIQLEAKDNITVITADVTNRGETVDGDYEIEIKFVDEDGNTIIEILSYINEVQPGETISLSTSTQRDFANAYDMEIVKK